MRTSLWSTLALTALVGQTWLVACGSDDNATSPDGAGGEAGGAVAAGGAAQGGSGNPAAGVGPVSSGGTSQGGAPGAPEGGTGSGGENNGSEGGESAAGGAPGLALVHGHCFSLASGFCGDWLVPAEAAELPAADCEDGGDDSFTECGPGYYGVCQAEGPAGSRITEYNYLLLGGPSREELEPQRQASCEGRGGVWTSEP